VGAHDQADALSAALGAPASSASLAFVRAVQAMGLRRVAVAATYPQDVAESFSDFLASGGVEVAGLSASDIMTATEAGQVDDAAVLRMVLAGDRPDAQAVLVPDTALHTVDVLPSVEAQLGKPVLTANQVCVWEALRLVGVEGAADDAGQLFAQPVNGSARGRDEAVQSPRRGG
jgi:maleate cis-trans isomerase